jgi:hypothetical protein
VSAVPSVPVSIRDTCFIDNDFIGDGAVLAGSLEKFNQSNVYGTIDTGLVCPFAMIDGGCIEYSSTTCRGVATSPTAASPVVTADGAKNETSTSGTASVTLGFSLVGAVLVFLL